MVRNTTQVRQLVNKLPHYIGYSDSCGIGTGGVWTSILNKIVSIVWQEEWPQKVKDLFNEHTLTTNNPRSVRASSKLSGARMPYIQSIKYPRIPLLRQHSGGGVDIQANIRVLTSSRTSPPLPRHAHPCSTSFTPRTHQRSRRRQ